MQKEEKERVKSRLATMEPLLQNSFVHQRQLAIGNHAAEAARREAASIVTVPPPPPPPPPGETSPLAQDCAEWPPIAGQTAEVYSRRLRLWVPATVTRVDGDEATVTYKEGSRRGTKTVAIDDPRVMRWSLQAWLGKYRLDAYTKALASEGYDGHPGYLCAVGDQEVEDLVQAVGMKRPQAKVFRQAVLDLNEPRPEQTPFTLTTNLLADKGSSGSSDGSEGYTYESVTDSKAVSYAKPAEVAMVGGTQQATPEQGGSGRGLLLLLFVLALIGGGGYFGCSQNALPASVCFGIGGGGDGPEPEPDPNPDPGPGPGPVPGPEPEPEPDPGPGPGPVSLPVLPVCLSCLSVPSLCLPSFDPRF